MPAHQPNPHSPVPLVCTCHRCKRFRQSLRVSSRYWACAITCCPPAGTPAQPEVSSTKRRWGKLWSKLLSVCDSLCVLFFVCFLDFICFMFQFCSLFYYSFLIDSFCFQDLFVIRQHLYVASPMYVHWYFHHGNKQTDSLWQRLIRSPTNSISVFHAGLNSSNVLSTLNTFHQDPTTCFIYDLCGRHLILLLIS